MSLWPPNLKKMGEGPFKSSIFRLFLIPKSGNRLTNYYHLLSSGSDKRKKASTTKRQVDRDARIDVKPSSRQYPVRRDVYVLCHSMSRTPKKGNTAGKIRKNKISLQTENTPYEGPHKIYATKWRAQYSIPGQLSLRRPFPASLRK